MSSSARWGSLLLSSVAALACAPVPEAVEPRSMPTPRPVEAPPPPKPPEAPDGVSDFHRALPDTPTAPTRGDGRTDVRRLAYGRGTFELRTYHRWSETPPACPIQTERGCASFSITSTGVSPASTVWPIHTPEPAADKLAPHGPFAAPQEWVDFASGRDVVYALRRGGEGIDRIDDQGKVSVLSEDKGLEGWEKFTVIEQGSRLFVAGQPRIYSAPWMMAEVTGGKLGPFAKLPMAPMPEYRPNAQGARAAANANGMAMFGDFQLVSSDEATPDGWTAVWLETVPPPFTWPAGKPRKNPLPPRKAKNGCGGPPSRTLDDRSVEKRAHVTRFRGTEAVDDTVAWATNELNPYEFQLTFHVEKGKIKVEPPPKGKAKPLDYSTVRPQDNQSEATLYAPNESVLGLGFDPASGEGMLVARQGNGEIWTRTFNAQGAFTGEPARYSASFDSELLSLHRIGGKWIGVQRSNNGLVNLTDPAPPIAIPRPHTSTVGAYAEGDQLRLLSYHDHIIWRTTVNLQGEVQGERERIAGVPEDFTYHSPSLHTGPGLEPMLFIVGRSDDKARAGWMPVKPGATWTFADLPAQREVRPYEMFFHHLLGDLVLVYRDGKTTHQRWLRTGEDASSEDEVNASRSYGPDTPPPGPLFGSPLVMLPAQAGKPLKVEGASVLEKECGQQIAVSATTVVLACSRAADAFKPGMTVGIRTLHIDR